MSLSLLLVISGCSILQPQKQVVVQTKFVEKQIPLQPRPKPLNLDNIAWKVVTQDNLQEFLQTFEETSVVFFAISVQDYETLSLNMAEIRRYIEQQKAVIVYYENAISSKKEPLTNETK
jgi:hypothetical protein